MTDATATPVLTARLHAIRRAAIITIIVSLSLTALIGIVTLLTGSFGEVQGRIMLTTLLIGGTSVLALCDLAVSGRRFQLAGFAGIAVALVGLVAGLILIWGSVDSEGVWKTFGLAGIAAVSFAQANLLLLLGERRRTVVRTGLWVTIGLVALVLVLLFLLVLTDGEVSSDGYARLLGSAAILDVLGTILVPVISRFLRDERPAAATATVGAPAAELTVRLSAELRERLEALAASTGRSPQEVAVAAIEDALGAS